MFLSIGGIEMRKIKLILGASILLLSVQVNAARVDVTVDFTGEYLRSSTVTNNSDDGLIINRITYGLGEADDGIGTWDSTDCEIPNLPPDSYATDFLSNPEYFQTLNFDVYLEPGNSYSEGSPTTRPFNDFDLIVRLSPLMVNGGATATSYALSRAYAEVEFITGDIIRVPLIEQDPSLTQTVYITGEIVTSVPTPIDIKRNKINPSSKGEIWVAILSDTSNETPFNPLDIEIPTIRFGPDEAETIRHRVKDVNRDGVADLLFKFKIRKTGIVCGDTEATLTGETFGGTAITGSDMVKTIKCK